MKTQILRGIIPKFVEKVLLKAAFKKGTSDKKVSEVSSTTSTECPVGVAIAANVQKPSPKLNHNVEFPDFYHRAEVLANILTQFNKENSDSMIGDISLTEDYLYEVNRTAHLNKEDLEAILERFPYCSAKRREEYYCRFEVTERAENGNWVLKPIDIDREDFNQVFPEVDFSSGCEPGAISLSEYLTEDMACPERIKKLTEAGHKAYIIKEYNYSDYNDGILIGLQGMWTSGLVTCSCFAFNGPSKEDPSISKNMILHVWGANVNKVDEYVKKLKDEFDIEKMKRDGTPIFIWKSPRDSHRHVTFDMIGDLINELGLLGNIKYLGRAESAEAGVGISDQGIPFSMTDYQDQGEIIQRFEKGKLVVK